MSATHFPQRIESLYMYINIQERVQFFSKEYKWIWGLHVLSKVKSTLIDSLSSNTSTRTLSTTNDKRTKTRTNGVEIRGTWLKFSKQLSVSINVLKTICYSFCHEKYVRCQYVNQEAKTTFCWTDLDIRTFLANATSIDNFILLFILKLWSFLHRNSLYVLLLLLLKIYVYLPLNLHQEKF